jgi:hypothetical protein
MFDRRWTLSLNKEAMKTKILTALCILTVGLGSATPARATDNSVEVVADAVIVRPACFVATVIGTAFFVIALPVAATSRSVKKTAHTLVVDPAKATFTRPLGDFTGLEE